MASIVVRGQATIKFETELDVDIDNQVSEYLAENLSSEFDLWDAEVDEVVSVS